MKALWLLLSCPTLFMLAAAALAFRACNSALDFPDERSLVPVEGTVVSSEVLRKKKSVTGVEFRLSGRPETWRYRSSYPSFDEARTRLVPGAHVRLWAPLDGRRGRGRPDFWRLEASGSTVVTYPAMKSKAKQQGRGWALAGVFCLLGFAFFGRQYWLLIRDEL